MGADMTTASTPDLTAVRRAALQAARASAARDEAIRRARWDGATLRAIAEAAGLSYARIFQIVKADEDMP
jgi:hypothetical protein